MKPAILALLAILLVVALRRREPVAETPLRWVEPEDGVLPADPYPASLLA